MATLEDKPYVDLKISDKTGYEISGIFGDVFCDLKVNCFSPPRALFLSSNCRKKSRNDL